MHGNDAAEEEADGAVEVFCGREGFFVEEAEIDSIVRCLQKFAPWEFPAGTLSVAFLSDAEICKMHAEFLSDPSKTDVITFPGDVVFSRPRERPRTGVPAQKTVPAGEENAPFAGEICICVDQALRVATELNTAPEAELLLYLVHGWLHLAGLDDIEDVDRATMRSAESLLLGLLREKNLNPLKTASFPQ